MAAVASNQGPAVSSVTHVDPVESPELFPGRHLGHFFDEFRFPGTHRTLEKNRLVLSDGLDDLDEVRFSRPDADERGMLGRVNLVDIDVVGQNVFHEVSAVNSDSSHNNIFAGQFVGLTFRVFVNPSVRQIAQRHFIKIFVTGKNLTEDLVSLGFAPVRDPAQALDGQPLGVVGETRSCIQKLLPGPESLEVSVAVQEGQAAF